MAKKNRKAIEQPPEEKLQQDAEAEQAVERQPEEKLSEDVETVKDTGQQVEEQPPEDAEAEQSVERQPEEKLSEDAETVKDTGQQVEENSVTVFHGLPKKYKITCRNKITKQIGGIDFEDGVGYTIDSYAASWFAAKDGYTVKPAE